MCLEGGIKVGRLPYIRYLLRSQKKPLFFTFYVTSRCNLRCSHCFYWNSLNKLDELGIGQIRKLAKSLRGVLNVSLTGGEPFLRDDIAQIIEIFHCESRPAVVSIISNGSLPGKVGSEVEKALTRNSSMKLSALVSIDGPAHVHDKIRGKKGSYALAMKSLDSLLALRKKYRNLNVGVVTTVNSMNREHYMEFYDYAKSLGVDSVQLNFMRGKPKCLEAEPQDIKVYRKVADRHREDVCSGNIRGYSNFEGSGLYQAANIVFRKVIARTAKEGRYVLPCAAGRLNGVVYSNGDLYACEILETTKIGSLRDVGFNINRLWNSKRADAVRGSIYKTRCFCTHECQLTTSVLFNPVYLAKIAAEYARIRVHRLFSRIIH